jgi:hypothetical protein
VRAWHDSYVLVALVIAGVVIVVAVILAAIGRGGELSAERNDYAPLELGPLSATDVALLRPPTAAWGYNMQATDEALARIAESIRERDVRIVALEQLVTDLSQDTAPPPLASPYVGARRRRALPDATAPAARPAAETRADEALWRAPAGQPAEPAGQHGPPEVTWAAGTAWSREAASPAETPWPPPATRPDPAIRPEGSASADAAPGDAARPEAGRPEEAGQQALEGQPGPPEQSHD